MKKEGLDKEELIKVIKVQAREGKITCAKAWELADQFNCPKSEISDLLNELKIKIIHCQLGCF